MIRNSLTIRNRFLLFGLLSLLPVLGLGIFLVYETNRATQNETVSSQTTVSSLVSNSVTNFLNANFRAMEIVANNPAVQQPEDIDAINTILGQSRTYRQEQIGLYVIGPDGGLIAQSGVDAELVIPGVDRQITSVLSTGLRTVSPRVQLTLDEPTNVVVLLMPITTISETETTQQSATPAPQATDVINEPTPIPTATPESTTRPAGSTLGVVISVINVESINQFLVPQSRGKNEIVIVSDEQVIAATSDIMGQQDKFLQELRNQDVVINSTSADVFRMVGPTGRDKIATYTPLQVDGVNWALVVNSPTPVNLFSQVWQQLGSLTVGSALVTMGLAFAFGEITSRSLSDLVAGAKRLASGDFQTPIARGGTGEVLELSDALIETRNNLATVVQEDEEHRTERIRQTEQMRDLLRRDLKVQEDERRHLAAEMHDAVSPLITGALYQSRALQMANGSASDENVKSTLQDVNNLLERASQELHGIIFDLRPPDLDDIGVVAAIEAFVSSIQRTGLQARLVVVDDPPPLSSEVRLGIYRIVQEALHNVLRHSSADEAVVRMEYQNDLLRVTIRDNGVGFDPNKARRPTSLGLLSMRERAAAIGADFEILSRPSGGTAIVIERRDTGSVMSDELLDDLLAHRAENGRLAEPVETADNTESTTSADPAPAEDA